MGDNTYEVIQSRTTHSNAKSAQSHSMYTRPHSQPSQLTSQQPHSQLYAPSPPPSRKLAPCQQEKAVGADDDDSLYEEMKPLIKTKTYQDIRLPRQASKGSGSHERAVGSTGVTTS